VDVIHLHGRVLVVPGRDDEPAIGSRDDTHVLHADQAPPALDKAGGRR
jgi:hypothetical protein